MNVIKQAVIQTSIELEYDNSRATKRPSEDKC